ncbi:GNAT family N-acetyltransferase [Fundicoccus culcitae]|uniref:GNAT family N-acetyltransferase n=1 Tax=Fundicoccus culcitae TaxID=2969821 RepID=A0ABY5P306_9LACT|nr:GNAT family N-acetyltransferase [Fundicoccus culcitae]UUX33116.1 GNAT family N-acetyltransferase [Fundicoccus culcitae]
MQLRRLNTDDFLAIQSLYHQLIDMMEGSPYIPGWEKGVYPSDKLLLGALNKEELYAVEVEGIYVAALIINHEYNEGYKEVVWDIDAKDEEITVIHALAVLPTYHGKGLATFLVQEVIRLAKATHQKVVRMDVLASNLPAQRLYTKLGFKLIDTTHMFYEGIGWTDYLMYEYAL